VLALFAALLILFILPLTSTNNKTGIIFYPTNQILFWILTASWLILTWIGGRPVEDPYILIGQSFTIIYFRFYILNPLSSLTWDHLIKI
jgi:ubiquinol-cytochrome c reductase cytochrome b subunit